MQIFVWKTFLKQAVFIQNIAIANIMREVLGKFLNYLSSSGASIQCRVGLKATPQTQEHQNVFLGKVEILSKWCPPGSFKIPCGRQLSEFRTDSLLLTLLHCNESENSHWIIFIQTNWRYSHSFRFYGNVECFLILFFKKSVFHKMRSNRIFGTHFTCLPE